MDSIAPLLQVKWGSEDSDELKDEESDEVAAAVEPPKGAAEDKARVETVAKDTKP